MPHPLVISSAAGLLISAACLGLAVRIGGDDIFHDARALDQIKPLIDVASHKAWRWNGGDTLAMDAPINIRYEPQNASGDSPQVSVTGPAELVRHVRVSEGRIAADTSVTRASGKSVEAVVRGAPIRKFIVNGGENLDLGDIDQPGLDVYLNGSGTVSGRGKVSRLSLTIAGPGKANLGGLSVNGDAKISILGSGDASLSPHGPVRLFIAGSGNLQLLTKPTDLRQTIIGSGEVSQLAGDAAREALKGVDASRIASDAARSAIQATLGSGQIGEITAEAVRNGIASAEIDRHVREGVARGMANADASIDAKSGDVFVRGSHDVELGHIERPSLKVTIANSGSASADGKVDELTVNLLGSGNARFGKLAARSVSVQIMGSGNVTVAPTEDLKVTIMGSGDVHLLTHPARIERQIMGSGRVIEDH
jgi:hypothetical protein